MANASVNDWDESSPTNPELVSAGANEIRLLRGGVRVRNDKEHVECDVDGAGGEHKQGSARCFYGTTAPATRVNGDAFTSDDLGSIWIYTDSSPVNQISILTAATPTWTPISTEIIASLLAAARIFASTLRVIGDFDVNTNKFNVAAASGNTLIAGTLGVTGIATLAKASLLASTDAPTTDAMLAHKKYVDDKVAAVPSHVFGTWESKSNNVEYTATTDGIVTAMGSNSDLSGYTPTATLRVYCHSGGYSEPTQGITFPVRKGDTWKVTGATTVFWLPIGT